MCKYRYCSVIVSASAGRGGRKKEYCDDQCRQAEHRARIQDEAKQAALQEVESWGYFQSAVRDLLAGYIVAGTRDTARKMADLFLAEQNAARISEQAAQAGRITPDGELARSANDAQRAALAQLLIAQSKEQKYPALRLSGYLRLFGDNLTERDLPDIEAGRSAWQSAVSILDVPALLVALTSLQARHALEDQRSLMGEQAWRDHLVQERLERELDQARKATTPALAPGEENEHVATLTRQLEDAQRGLEQVQESYRQYVATTNTRLSEMSGELARYRQEQERGDLPDTLAKMAKMRSQLAELESKLRWQEDANHTLAESRNRFLLEGEELRKELTRYRKEERLRNEIRENYARQQEQDGKPRCSTIHEGAMIDQHKPNEAEPGVYDERGNYWCADCQDAVACMANGAKLGWPEVYVFPYNPPEHRTLMVRAGEEKWYEYLRVRGKHAQKTIREKTNDLLRDRARGIWPPQDDQEGKRDDLARHDLTVEV